VVANSTHSQGSKSGRLTAEEASLAGSIAVQAPEHSLPSDLCAVFLPQLMRAAGRPNAAKLGHVAYVVAHTTIQGGSLHPNPVLLLP
jgi:hypothetical protein